MSKYTTTDFPKVGMKYEQAAWRLKKHKSVEENITTANSLVNQVYLHEGQTAAYELAKEYASHHNGLSVTFSGKYNRSCGTCFKYDCINRNKLCRDCFKDSLYKSSG